MMSEETAKPVILPTTPQATKPEAAPAKADAPKEAAPAPKPVVAEAKTVEPEVAEEEQVDPSTIPPKNVDPLMQSTARFSRRGWDAFLSYKDDLDAIFRKRIECHMEARSPEGAAELAEAMRAVSIPAVTVTGPKLHTITTFAKLQEIIKHPALMHVDAVKAD
jgi:hypothetical protein